MDRGSFNEHHVTRWNVKQNIRLADTFESGQITKSQLITLPREFYRGDKHGWPR